DAIGKIYIDIILAVDPNGIVKECCVRSRPKASLESTNSID
ncbi:hypothetical protein L915_19405, partial [Phytophthora nicotianae]